MVTDSPPTNSRSLTITIHLQAFDAFDLNVRNCRRLKLIIKYARDISVTYPQKCKFCRHSENCLWISMLFNCLIFPASNVSNIYCFKTSIFKKVLYLVARSIRDQVQSRTCDLPIIGTKILKKYFFSMKFASFIGDWEFMQYFKQQNKGVNLLFGSKSSGFWFIKIIECPKLCFSNYSAILPQWAIIESTEYKISRTVLFCSHSVARMWKSAKIVDINDVNSGVRKKFLLALCGITTFS